MTEQEKLEKKREADRLRKRKSRAKLKAKKAARGAEVVETEIYRGTRHCLDELMTTLDYEQEAEIITRLIHGAHRLLQCDRSQVEALLKV